MASKYTSIQRNMRGFNYQRDYRTLKDFWVDMSFQISHENDEIEWAKLFDAQSGDEVAHYRRGCEFPEI